MKKRNSRQGVTMVEVVIAFMVLMVIMAIFSQAVSLTGRVMDFSGDILKGYRDLQGEYYLEGSGVAEVEAEDFLEFSRIKKDENGKDVPTGDRFRIEGVTVRKFYNGTGEIWDVVVNPAGK